IQVRSIETCFLQVAPYFGELRPVVQVAQYFDEIQVRSIETCFLQVTPYFGELRPVLQAGGPFLPMVELKAASLPLVGVGLSTSQPPPYTVEDVGFDAFGYSIKDFTTRRVLLRCYSMGDLYQVMQPSLIPHAFLTSQHTWHPRHGNLGSEVLRRLVSRNLISCNKEKHPILCHAWQAREASIC
nr:ribonuclease H-like domain-containing protein [Tanacetum cinerariifolium]